jgi:hypothetical protein
MTFNNDNDIREFLTEYDVSKIFGNKENAIEFLLFTIDLTYKELNKKKSKEIYQLVMNSWDYNQALPIIREMAFKKKYNRINYNLNKNSYNKTCLNLIKRFGGNNNWGFNPFDYDGHMTRYIRNSKNIMKDTNEYVELVVKNLWIKSLNMYRSYLFEYFIIKNKKDILPTLGNKSLTDFYYLGKSRDQKNSKSVTTEFEKDYGSNWKETALTNPELVAKYLYTNQGEGRFGFEPRLFIINLKDGCQTVEEIEEISKNINFGESLPIDFEYKGVEYKTDAIVIYV